jgi:DNA polymerase III sliding clamp (beta) subunit (PCNA family)
VGAPLFLDALARTVDHASTHETRAELNVVRLEVRDGTLLTIAADGATLALLRAGETAGTLGRAPSLHRLSVPILSKLFGDLGGTDTLLLATDDNRLRVESDAAIALVRLVDAPFPDYPRLLAQVPTHVVVVNRTALIAAARRVALTSDESNRITLRFHDCVTVSATGQGIGRAKDVVPVASHERIAASLNEAPTPTSPST